MSLVRSLVRPLVSPLVGPLVGFGGAEWTPAQLFLSGEDGAWYDPSDLSTLWQDTAATTPAAVNDPVGRMDDKSGNGNNATQGTAAARPILRQSGSLYYLEVDGVDDAMTISIALTQMTLAAAARVATASAVTSHMYSSGVAANALLFRRTADDSYFSVNSNNLFNTTSLIDADRVFVATQNATDGIYRVDQNETTASRSSAAATYNRLFSRVGTINAMAGRYYGGVIRDAATTGDDLTNLEAYLAGKIGI